MIRELELSVTPFGSVNGEEVYRYRISNGEIDIEVMNYGCTILSLFTPDRWGKKRNIVAGFDHLSQYLLDHPYLGCVVGRFANRIAFGKFSLNGISYHLPLNDGVNHLHGGIHGFNRKVWKAEKVIEGQREAGIVFTYLSKDGEEGYPGNAAVSLTYLLNEENELCIQYEAVSDKPTIISLTNHSYFNLTGFEEDTIYNHYLQINADQYTVKNANNTPSGEIAFTDHTPLHFYKPKRIGEAIHQLEVDRGYDHNFVLKNNQQQPAFAARLYDEASGRSLTVYTNQPGMQVYTANWWDGQMTGAHNRPYCKHGAIALETQAFPDAPNQPHFPSAVLQPGQQYSTQTTFQFQIENPVSGTGNS